MKSNTRRALIAKFVKKHLTSPRAKSPADDCSGKCDGKCKARMPSSRK